MWDVEHVIRVAQLEILSQAILFKTSFDFFHFIDLESKYCISNIGHPFNFEIFEIAVFSQGMKGFRRWVFSGWTSVCKWLYEIWKTYTLKILALFIMVNHFEIEYTPNFYFFKNRPIIGKNTPYTFLKLNIIMITFPIKIGQNLMMHHHAFSKIIRQSKTTKLPAKIHKSCSQFSHNLQQFPKHPIDHL